MGHKMTWLLEKRVILLEYSGDVNKAELKEINEELNRFFAEGEKPVHVISDNRQMGNVELSISIAKETFSAVKQPGWGWMFLIGLDRLIRFFAEVFATQFGVRIKSANNPEEALEALKKLDLSLLQEADKKL